MNEYKYNDLEVGMTENFQQEITAEMMDSFIRLSGDINPLHKENDFAKAHGFNGRVVYGMLSAALISRMGGVHLPGKYCLIQQVEVKFVRPVYIGDILTVSGTVKELNDSVQQAVIKIEMKNQNSEKVVRGNLYVGFLEK